MDENSVSSIPSSSANFLSRSASRPSISRSRVSARGPANGEDRSDEIVTERKSDTLSIKSGDDWDYVRMGRRWEGAGEAGERRERERSFLSFLDGSATSSLERMKESLERERGNGLASSLTLTSGTPHLSVPSFAKLVTDCGKLKVFLLSLNFFGQKVFYQH